MFRFHRIARASRGKLLQAIQWAKEVSGYINEKYAPVSVQAYIEQFGDGGTIHWFSDFEHVADWETLNAQLLADQGYWALLDKAADLFIEGSLHDTLVQSV